MKTKELIRQLQELDSTGEEECCIWNQDIHFISRDPAYWDGKLQVLIRDETNTKCYNIIGAKYKTSGCKISIRPLSISDAIMTAEEFSEHLPIDYSELGAERAKEYMESNEKTRQQAQDIGTNVEKEHFTHYIKERAAQISGNTDFGQEIERFFNANLTKDDPIPEDICNIKKSFESGGKTYESHLSYNDKRKLQWDREIYLSFDGIDWHISKK